MQEEKSYLFSKNEKKKRILGPSSEKEISRFKYKYFI